MATNIFNSEMHSVEVLMLTAASLHPLITVSLEAIHVCCGFTPTGSAPPCHSHSTTERGGGEWKGNMILKRSSWVEIRTARLLTNNCH